MLKPMLLFVLGACAALLVSQQSAPAAQKQSNDGKVRVYVSDSQSWQVSGGWGAANGA